MIKSIYNPFILQPLPKLLSQLGALFDGIFMFNTYYLYSYKEKLEITKSAKELVTNLTTFNFVYNNDDYADQLDLVTKKKEPLRTLIYYLFHFF